MREMMDDSTPQKHSQMMELVVGRSAASSIARGASLFLGVIALYSYLIIQEEHALVSRLEDPRRLVAPNASLTPCVTSSCIKSSDPSSIDWDNIFQGQPTQDLQVPRILHMVILGDKPPPSMIQLVKWNFHYIRSNGYQTKLWRDADVEELIDTYGPRVREMWEYAKADDTVSRPARLTDIARVLIVFAEGGVHIDADTIMCGKQLDKMVDKPGVVSFPFQLDDSAQVTTAMVSGPPGHRLMGMAMESFIALGPEIGTLPNLEAAGPHEFAKVVDEYIKAVGIEREPIYTGTIGYPPENPSGAPIPGGSFWGVEISDLRFGNNFAYMNSWHIGFGSWFKNRAPPVRPCDVNVDLVNPWIDDFCTNPSYRRIISTGCFHPIPERR
jgi:hypothetical protein